MLLFLNLKLSDQNIYRGDNSLRPNHHFYSLYAYNFIHTVPLRSQESCLSAFMGHERPTKRTLL